MSRVLVTGATGFIGGWLVRSLMKQHDIFGLAREIPVGACPTGIHWIQQDLTEPLDYARLPLHIDAVIHLAQSKLYRQFPDEAAEIFDINIQSTFRLLEYARRAGVESFIFASTGGVYGYKHEKLVETDPISPLNFYLSSKYAAELLVANYRQFFRTVVFRFFFVYGPGQKGMLIPTLLHKVRNGETIVIEGNPGLNINPIFVEDAVRVFEPAWHLNKSELLNVAGDEIVTITDLVKLIGKVSGTQALVQHSAANPDGDLVGDNTRMKELLKVHPQTPLFQGLKYMLQMH